MKRVVNIRFSWEEGRSTSEGPSYVLTTIIGTASMGQQFQLFSDQRGFYSDIDNPVVFTKGLSAAKKRIENGIVKVLTAAPL